MAPLFFLAAAAAFLWWWKRRQVTSDPTAANGAGAFGSMGSGIAGGTVNVEDSTGAGLSAIAGVLPGLGAGKFRLTAGDVALSVDTSPKQQVWVWDSGEPGKVVPAGEAKSWLASHDPKYLSWGHWQDVG